MRKTKLFVLTLTLTLGNAFAEMGDLVGSFPNVRGNGNHHGLAADRNFLYSFYESSSENHPIHILYKNSGGLYGSYRTPLQPYNQNYGCYGLGYEAGDPGGYLHINNYYTRTVGKFRASNGSLISTWNWPAGIRYSLCVDNDKEVPRTAKGIWQNDNLGNFWYSTTTGSLVSSFKIGNTYSYDLAWDYKNNLVWFGNIISESVNGMTTAGSVMYSWRVPSAVLNPYGVAYYGQYLYVNTTGGTPEDYIWVYHCPISVGVHPSSFGEIKALFQ